MITRWLKMGAIATVGLGLAGGLLFGKDVVSYVRSSAKSVRTVVKDSVPIEFELRRASDLLEDIIPEMHANIRLIAQEEVEVAALKDEIAKNQESLDEERGKIKVLRGSLETTQVQYCFAGRQYSRDDVKADLAARFERIKESELVLTSKQRLLTSRENSLHAAMQLLDKTRSQKRILENKIETLASQYRLVKAAAVGSKFQVDNSKLAQTEKLIGEIQKRLDVAERVLAHESRFVEAIPVDTVPEADLVAQVDEYFQQHEAPEDGDMMPMAKAAAEEPATH
jgi:chromosome segregation ATPase